MRDAYNPGGTFLGIYGGFSVVLVRKGDRYGAENCLTHEKDDPMVEFYDADYAKPGFTKVGQFVSRYYLSTLTERPATVGLILDGGIPKWSISAEALAVALQAVKFALSF